MTQARSTATVAFKQDRGPRRPATSRLNGSVGQFGTSTLVASTAALASSSKSDDTKYADIDGKLSTLGSQRDTLATNIKTALDQVEFHGAKLDNGTVSQQLGQLQQLVGECCSAGCLRQGVVGHNFATRGALCSEAGGM